MDGRQDDKPSERLVVWQASPQLWEKLKPLAREKRAEPTPAENLLWQRLRNKQVDDAKFRRQYAIDKFIVDFYCLKAKLIIEVDGTIHEYTTVEDAVRQDFLESLGNRVLRFNNDAVITSSDHVIARISATLTEINSITGSPSPVGEGVRG